MPDTSKKKSLSRNLGEFVGHIFRGFKTKVDEDGNQVRRTEVNRTVEEEKRSENVTLRRTTIEEVEIREHPERPKS